MVATTTRLTGALLALVLLVLVQGVVSSSFVCSPTIDLYNQYVNVGQFREAADATFAENVVVRRNSYCFCPSASCRISEVWHRGGVC